MDVARINQHKQALAGIGHFVKSDYGREQVEIWSKGALQVAL